MAAARSASVQWWLAFAALHLTVLLWGVTSILGKLISCVHRFVLAKIHDANECIHYCELLAGCSRRLPALRRLFGDHHKCAGLLLSVALVVR